MRVGPATAGAIAGIGFVLSMPPFAAGPLVLVAFAPLAMAVAKGGVGGGARVGAVAGAVVGGAMIPALVMWPGIVSLAAVLVCVLAYGLFGALAAAGSKHLGVAAPALAWIVTLGVAERMHLPLALSPGLLDTWPALGPAYRSIGVAGVDAIVLLVNAAIARAIATRRIGALVAAAGGIVVAVLMAPPLTEGASVEIAALQTDYGAVTLRSSQASLLARRRLELRFDRLTREAIQGGAPDLVVWPEGGNLLSNRGLDRRRAALAVLAPSTDVLVAGREVRPDGRVSNAVALLREGAFTEEVAKAHTVPFAESAYEAGRPGVLHTRAGVVGIAICFEGLFRDHLAELVERGAEIIVLPSDDASFGATTLPAWHRAIARARAAEVGRPLVFVGQAAPSGAYDADGRVIVEIDEARRTPWRATVRPTSGDPRRTFMAEVLIAMIALFFAMGARVRTFAWIARRSKVSAATAVAMLSLVVLAPAIGAIASLAASPSGARVAIEDAAARVRVPAVPYGMASMFQQARPQSCGAAALAFAMTALGDEVFENALWMRRPPSAPEGYAFDELRALARERGFEAVGFTGGVDDLATTGALDIAHFAAGHFVVVLGVERDAVSVMDPATGRIESIARDEFDARYSGRFLRVAPGADQPKQMFRQNSAWAPSGQRGMNSSVSTIGS